MRKILLVRPPSTYGNNLRGFQLEIPIGLLYIASVLEKNGYEVKVFDCRVDFDDPRLLNTYENRDYVEKHWGNAFMRIVQNIAPDIVGISNQFSAQTKNAIKVAELVKQVNPNIVTIVGGPHASVLPQCFFNFSKSIDFVIIGEGEYTFLKLVKSLRNNKKLSDLPGVISYDDIREGNFKPQPILDLDNLPFPSYHLVNLEKYFQAEKLGFEVRGRYKYPRSERAVPMITSRGCPYECIFCSVHLHMGRKWRAHSYKYVIEHIKYLVDKYGVKHIHFEDDSINIDAERFESIIDELIRNRFEITWDTPNGLRVDNLTYDLLKKIKTSKCTYLIIGVESGSQRVIDEIIHKKINLEKVKEVARLCRDLEIDLRAFYVFGFPGESIDDIKKTIDFALELFEKYGVYPYIHIAMPYIGTKLYSICKEKGYLKISLEDIDNSKYIISGTPLIETQDFSILDIERLHTSFHLRLRNLVIKNYLKLPKTNPEFIDEVLNYPIEKIEEKIKEIVEYQNCKRRKDLMTQ
ncbi:MAG: B12-binding domain-containing radical SAM protein [Endomicrobia bacterium]|nr:B12-binding domain-containing radical SAM protein [Endomicrobiia bacterium]